MPLHNNFFKCKALGQLWNDRVALTDRSEGAALSDKVSTQIWGPEGDAGSYFRIAAAPQFWLKEFGKCT